MKKLLAGILSMVLLFSVSACSKDGTATSDGSTDTSTDVEWVFTAEEMGNKNAEIVLRWQPNPAHSLAATTNQSKVDYLNSAIEQWCHKHPEVRIEVVDTTTAINESMAKTLVEAASGQSPDMGAIDSFVFPQFYDYVQPMDDALQAHGVSLDDFYDFTKDVMAPAGETLGIWYTTDVRVLFYRKDLIETPPATWEEVLSVGAELKEQGMDAFLYTAARDEATVMASVLPYFWGQGGTLVDEAGTPVFGEGDNREALINQLTFQQQCMEEGVTPNRVLNFGTDSDYMSDVAAGTVGMFVAGNNVAANIISIIGQEAFDQVWGVSYIPMAEEGQHATAAGGWVACVFTEDEEKRALCADFLMSIYGNDEGMSGWCQAGGYLPTRKSVYEKDEYFSTDSVMQFCSEYLNNASVRPSVEKYTEISEALQIMLSNVLSGAMTPEQAVDDAFETAMQN